MPDGRPPLDTHVVLDPTEFMRHIRVPHPFGAASGCANRRSCRFGIARLAAPEVPLATRARSLIDKTLTHLAARNTECIHRPRAPPLHTPQAQLAASPSPSLSWVRPRVHHSPATPRLPCPPLSSAFLTCLHVCRPEIASPRPRFDRSGDESRADRTNRCRKMDGSRAVEGSIGGGCRRCRGHRHGHHVEVGCGESGRRICRPCHAERTALRKLGKLSGTGDDSDIRKAVNHLG